MPDADAAALIRRRLTEPGVTLDDSVNPIAVEFARRLGRWPLAIDLACAWVRGLGGNLERLPAFVARLDRFHITEEDGTTLGSYHSAVGILVRELWSALSTQARGVLAMVVVSGGSAVPAALVEDWGHAVTSRYPLAFDAQAAMRELVGASLLTRRLRGDAHKVSRYDEIISAHDGISFALNSAGLGVDGALTYVWLEVCAEALIDAFGLAQIADAEALAPPIGSFLGAFLSPRSAEAATDGQAGARARASIESDAHDMQRMLLGTATTVMHNLGSLELLTGRYERGAFWLASAVRVREELSPNVDGLPPAFAATQIQTLGQLIQAEARMRRFERIRPLVARALAYARDPQVFEVHGLKPPVAVVLDGIAENSQLATDDCADLRAQIEESLQGRDIAPGPLTVLDARVQKFGEETARASALAEEEQWSSAVETLLTAVAPSVRDGALMSESVEAALDVALLLLGSMLRRSPNTLASSWWSAFRALAEWCSSVELVDKRQCVRVSFLRPIAHADLDELSLAAEEARDTVTGDRQLEVWVQIAGLAMEWLARPASDILPGLGAMPPGMTIFRRVSVSEEILLRPVLFEGKPGLVVHTPGLLVRSEDREVGHIFHMLVELGFPCGPDKTGAIQVADGWSFRLREGGRYELTDPRGQVIFVLEPENHAHRNTWDESLHRTGAVSIICRDPADTDPVDVFATPEQAVVRVVGTTPSPDEAQDVLREARSAPRRPGLLGGLWSQLRETFAAGRGGSEPE